MEIRAQTAPAAIVGGLEYSRETQEEPIEHTDDMTKQVARKKFQFYTITSPHKPTLIGSPIVVPVAVTDSTFFLIGCCNRKHID